MTQSGKHRTDPKMPRVIAKANGVRLTPESDRPELRDLVQDGVPVDLDGEPKEPTNPDLWGDDPYYDHNDRPRFAAWAVALCLVTVLLIVGGVSWMFGAGSVEATPVSDETITMTSTVSGPAPAPKTITKTIEVIRKSQVTLTPAPQAPKVVISTKTIAPQSTLTAYRTRPRVTVTVRATITRTATSAPSETIRCFRVRLGEIRAEIPCP